MADVRVEVEGALGVVTLARPHALNALDTDMALAAWGALEAWRDDPAIRAVWLVGEGERAFCAGGDVRAIAERYRDAPDGAEAFAVQYFTAEYELDLALHTYPKPVVVVGHGFVLGGGMGMLLGGSLRVVTPTSRLAMPEVRIGLFPDVGASWFLARLGAVGAWLALTGIRVGPADAIACGFADVHLPDDRIPLLRQAAARGEPVDAAARRLATPTASGELEARRARLDDLLAGEDRVVLRRLLGLVDDADPWIAAGAQGLAAGSPLAARLVLELLRRSGRCSLADVFRQDLDLALQCVRRPDFHEGVGALLIDKGRAPRWTWERPEDVPDEEVQACFARELDPHPLAHLAGPGRHERA